MSEPIETEKLPPSAFNEPSFSGGPFDGWKRSIWWKGCSRYLGMLGVLTGLIVLFGALSNRFLSPSTMGSIANQIPALTVISVGMTLVLIIGGIDLSVGSVLAFSTAMLGIAMVDWKWTLLPATGLCMAVGLGCGLVNGSISVLAKLPSFIVTLGMLEIARGCAYYVTESKTKYIGSDVEWLGIAISGFQVSPAFLIALGLVIVVQGVLRLTVFGRYCLAIGSNSEAVRLSGIRVEPYSIAVFGISGALCGLAGLMEVSRMSSADPNTSIGLELSAIAACVIGGTSLKGGRGSVVSTFFGVLIITVLQTGLSHLGAQESVKRIVTGSVIVIAVLLDAFRAK